MSLPQLDGSVFVTDGGLETTLVFDRGIALPDFAAFPLLTTAAGRTTLREYFAPYAELADRLGLGIVLDTPTWRASLDWGARLGFTAAELALVNRQAVEFIRTVGASRAGLEVVLNGVIGPRGDGYVVGERMSVREAAGYHHLQAHAFAAAGADMVTAVTMNYVDEAIGVVEASVSVGLPVVVSFTVETDGRLPSGDDLGSAIEAVDRATDAAPAYYMVNCAHPTHFLHVLDVDRPWLRRVRAIRANASALSHAELDEATELDRGDVAEFVALYRELRRVLPTLNVVGGCCGTDHEHVGAIASSLR
jgi:S-methylmethionine-dependent homocysteine/selenocysteine methylase